MKDPQPVEYYYSAFGMTIGSAFEIPELIPLKKSKPDVIIHEGEVPESLDNPMKVGRRLQIKPGHFLYRQDDVAGYHVMNGNRIVVQPSVHVQEKEVRLYLLGSVFGALVHQRGGLPFHASAIEVNGRCVLFCGQSRAGKSTTANAFVKRGLSYAYRRYMRHYAE